MTNANSIRAAMLRERAAKVREAAEALARGAENSPRANQEDLLRIQARILAEGAARLDDEALAIQPVSGRA